MKRRAWHELSGAEQRADVAQGFVRLSCAGTLLSLCVAIVMTLTGHPTIWHDLAAHPLQTARGVLFLLLYISAAVLMGRRRPAGGLIAIGLFGYAIISLAARGRLVVSARSGRWRASSSCCARRILSTCRSATHPAERTSKTTCFVVQKERPSGNTLGALCAHRGETAAFPALPQPRVVARALRPSMPRHGLRAPDSLA
jgi:hypothetical protein